MKTTAFGRLLVDDPFDQPTAFSEDKVYAEHTTWKAGDGMDAYVYFVFFLGLLVNFLLLLAVNSLCGAVKPVYRLLAAAAVGGIYSGACVLPGFHFLGNFLWRTVSLLVIAAVSFGISADTVRRGAVFVLLSMALSGTTAALGRTGALPVLLSAGVVLVLWGVYRYLRPELLIPVELSYGGITCRINALRDTGNSLKDPVTGEDVLVISAELAEAFTGLSRMQLKDPIGTMGTIPGLRLIPFHTVGSDGGMLLALRFPQVKIGRKNGSAIVAFSSEKLHGEGKYQALTGGYFV